MLVVNSYFQSDSSWCYSFGCDDRVDIHSETDEKLVLVRLT